MEPHSYFENKIKKLQNQLQISSDLAFLLLINYNWDEKEASQKWNSSPIDVAKLLNIPIGNDGQLNEHSLLSKELKDVEECPICSSELPLIQFYCGHKICKKCFIREFSFYVECENYIFWPNCGCRTQNESSCYALCIPSDVNKYIQDEQLLTKIKKRFLNDSMYHLTKARLCPNCNLVITEENEIGYGIAECPECKTKYCLNCLYQGTHVPLFEEEKLTDFEIDKKNELKILFAEQKKWIEREKRLKEYRKNHQEEIISYFDQKIESCIENNRKIEKDEISKISEISKKLESIKQQQSSTKLAYEKVVSQFESIHSKNCEERSKVLKKWKDLKELFQSSLNSDSDYPLKIMEAIDSSIIDNNIIFSEIDDTFSTLKYCPKCYSPILRNAGCLRYFCQSCGNEFCWACLKDWRKIHFHDHVCNQLSIAMFEKKFPVLNGINYDDEDDKKFYRIPFDFEKQAMFGRWNHLRKEKMKIIESNESLSFIFSRSNDENDVKFRLIQMMSNEADQKEDSKKLASKLLSDVLFAKSVIAWSYPAMFYIDDDIERKILEVKVDLLNEEVSDLIDSIKGQKIENPVEYFTQRNQKLNDDIESILAFVKNS